MLPCDATTLALAANKIYRCAPQVLCPSANVIHEKVHDGAVDMLP